MDSTVLVSWQTYSEMDLLGFELYRAVDPNSEQALVYSTQALHAGKMLGDTYQYSDSDVQAGLSYTYWLVVLLKDGGTLSMQPVTASLLPVKMTIYLPLVAR